MISALPQTSTENEHVLIPPCNAKTVARRVWIRIRFPAPATITDMYN